MPAAQEQDGQESAAKAIENRMACLPYALLMLAFRFPNRLLDETAIVAFQTLFPLR
jgi:hypothetical protein